MRQYGVPRGLGLYPGQACYDPSRPSWLPYWWDTNSENLCKFGFYPAVATLQTVPAPPAAAPPSAPQTQDQMTTPGAFTPAESAQGAADATFSAFDHFMSNLSSQTAFGGSGAPAVSWLDPSTWGSAQWVTVIALSALAGAALMGGRH